MCYCNNGKGGGLGQTLRNYQGWVWSILTVPYRGGKGVKKYLFYVAISFTEEWGRIQKFGNLPYVIYEWPLTRISNFRFLTAVMLKQTTCSLTFPVHICYACNLTRFFLKPCFTLKWIFSNTQCQFCSIAFRCHFESYSLFHKIASISTL